MGCGASSDKAGGSTDAAPTVAPSSPVPAGGHAQAAKGKQAAKETAGQPDSSNAKGAPATATPAAGATAAAAAGQAQPTTAAAPATAAAATAAAAGGSSQGLVAAKGLTLRGIRQLRNRIHQLCSDGFFKDPWDLNGEQKQGADSYEDLTTEQLVLKWVKPEVNAKGNAALMEAVAVALPDIAAAERGQLVGTPVYFVSHAWKGRVFRLFDTIEAFLANAADTTAVWLDFVALDQRRDDTKASEAAIHSLIAGFHSTLKACQGGMLVAVDMGSDDSNPAGRAWCTFEWGQCLAVHGQERLHLHGVSMRDRERIIAAIDQGAAKVSGNNGAETLAAINADIVHQHGSLAAFDRELKLQLLLEPLSYKADLDHLNTRSQSIQWKWHAVKAFVEGEQPGRAVGLLSDAGTGKSSVLAAMCQQLLSRLDPANPGQWLGTMSAAHFVRVDDQKRLDPVRIIKSLVYQLAIRSDAVADVVLKHSPEALLQLKRMEEAFDLLLLPAVECVPVPVVFVIDGLNEADPAEQQRPEFTGPVKACGNAVLRMVLSLFAKKLPENVRLVLSSRPEGCMGGMQDVLTRAFPNIKLLDPTAFTADGASDAPPRVVLYDAVTRDCKVELPPPEDGIPTLEGVHAAYKAVFDRSPPAAKTASLLQLLVAAQEPLSRVVLQQLGYDEAQLQQLPGWGSLFYEAEYHVHLLHKSLRDWLLLGSDTNPHAPDVSAGHRALAAHLLKDVCRASPIIQPSEYCLKYAYLHLCEAGPGASDLLDHALAQWEFVRAAFAAGHGSWLLAALGSVPRERLSSYAYDAYRWLARLSSDFEREPEALEDITMVRANGCPMLCAKFQEAAKTRQCQWMPKLQLGGSSGGWPADICTLKGKGAKVTSVAYSPDGRQVAATCDDGQVQVWDVAGGVCPATLRGHTQSVVCATFDKTGRQLVTGSKDNTVKVWDVASGTLLTSMSGHQGAVTSVVFSPDGKRLATGSEDTSTRLWDLAAVGNRCISVIQGSAIVTSLAFDPTGKQLAIGSEDGSARVWDLSLETFMLTLPGHKGWVTSVAFSATHLATGSGDKTAKLWDLETATCSATLAGHAGWVFDVAFAPGGRLVTAGGDATARVWDVATGACLTMLTGHADKVSGVAVHGNQLATGSEDGTVKVWDLSEDLGTGEGHIGPVTCVAVSPDAKLIATGSDDKTVRLWDAETGRCTATLQGHSDGVTSVAFHPSGKAWLASGSSDYTACVWDLSAGGACLATLQEHTDAVCGVAFALDGRLATASKDSTAKVWDLKDPAAVISSVTLQASAPVLSVSFSPDGTQLATGSESGVVALWDAAKGTSLVELPGHEAWVGSVAFSPDGRQVASGSGDSTTRVWDLGLAGAIATTALPAQEAAVWSVSYSPDGRQLAVGSDDGLCSLWDPYNAIPIAMFGAHNGPITSVTFSRNGCVLAMASRDGTATVWVDEARQEFIASLVPVKPSIWIVATVTSADASKLAIAWSDQTVQVWDISKAEKKCIATLGPVKAEVHSMAFSVDCTRLAMGNKDNTATVWDVAGAKLTDTFKGHKNWVTSVAFSPDGDLVATGSADGTARVWSFPAEGACIAALSGHRHTIVSAAFSPDGKRLATGSNDSTVRLWSIPGGQCAATLTGHSKAVNCVAFSPNGSQLATGSEDLTVQLWDLSEATPTREAFLGHKSGVRGVAFSADSKLLASIEDKTVRVWDLGSATCITPLMGHTDRIRGVVFKPDGKQLISTGWDNTLRLWPMANIRSKGERHSINIMITPDKQLVKGEAKAAKAAKP